MMGRNTLGFVCSRARGAVSLVTGFWMLACGGRAGSGTNPNDLSHGGAAVAGTAGSSGRQNEDAGGGSAPLGPSDGGASSARSGGAGESALAGGNGGRPGAAQAVAGATAGSAGSAGYGTGAAGSGAVVNEEPPPQLGMPCAFTADCGYRAACDPLTGTCVWPCDTYLHNSKAVPCPSGQQCTLLGAFSPSVCQITCTPGSCEPGLVCAAAHCMQPGSATLGSACASTETSSGCVSEDLSCYRGLCEKACDLRPGQLLCPTGGQCVAGVCTTRGDPAALGELCLQPAGPCGGNGSIWQGECYVNTGECLVRCDSNADCSVGQDCWLSNCRTICDPLAVEPGCPSPQQCSNGGHCSSTAGDAASIGQACAAGSINCASDGKAWRGFCEGIRNQCVALCKTQQDCGSSETCSSGLCLPNNP